jgi:hypothetical protein
MQAAYQIVVSGCHPDADTRELGRQLADALNAVMHPLTVTVAPQWVLVTEAERKAGES